MSRRLEFGDVVRRHEDGGEPDEQAIAMVISPDNEYGWYAAIGLGDQGSAGYRYGKIEKITIDYWTLVERR